MNETETQFGYNAADGKPAITPEVIKEPEPARKLTEEKRSTKSIKSRGKNYLTHTVASLPLSRKMSRWLLNCQTLFISIWNEVK